VLNYSRILNNLLKLKVKDKHFKQLSIVMHFIATCIKKEDTRPNADRLLSVHLHLFSLLEDKKSFINSISMRRIREREEGEGELK
jgi:hypothetical protein